MKALYGIPTRDDEHVTILSPLDALTQPSGAYELSQAIDSVYQTGKGLVLNLADVSSIDSSAVGLIAMTHRKFGGTIHGGGAFTLCNVNEKIKHVLDHTNLPRVLNIRGDESAAVQQTPARVKPKRPSGTKHRAHHAHHSAA